MDKAKIVRKLIFSCRLQTLAPLRIGSGMDDGLTDILILKNKQGNPVIPGTSLAGVLRGEIAAVYGEAAAAKMFGSLEGEDVNQSLLSISDVVLDAADIIVRDGVAIDPVLGVGIAGAKFDFEALERGALGDLLMELTLRQQDLDWPADGFKYTHDRFAAAGDCYGDMAATLADLLSGGINVGSMTAKGYGRLAGKEAVAYYDFDFRQPQAAEQWLTYLATGKLAKAAYVGSGENALAEQNFYLQADCALQGALLIRNDDLTAEQEAANISAVQLKSGKDYVIPGTSWKGVLRSRAHKILLALTGHDAGRAKAFLDDCFGFSAQGTEVQGKRSRLSVEESYISSSDLKAMVHSRNRIDRFTGGTVDSALFTDEPVWRQEREQPVITLKLCVKNCREAEAGLLLLFLKDLWLGNVNIGSGKGIGRGVLRCRHCRIDYRGGSYTLDEQKGFTVKGDKNALEGYVQALAGELNE